MLNEVYRYGLCELKGDVERLAKGDPSANVRRVASIIVEQWDRRGGAGGLSGATSRGTMADPGRWKPGSSAERAAVLVEARKVLEDPNASVRSKVFKLSAARSYDLRELRTVVTRLSESDPSERIRKSATHVLREWERRDLAAARAAARAEETARQAQMTPRERREREKAAQKRFYLIHRDKYLNDLKTGTLERRRQVAMLGFTWVDFIPEGLPIFRDILKNEKDLQLRYTAVRVLGKYDGQKAVPLIRECLRPRNPEELRRIAASRLARLGHKEGIPVLIEVLRTENALLQVGTIRSLRSVTGLHFGYPTRLSSTELLLPKNIELRNKAVRQWENWWKKNERTFEFPYPPR